MRLESIGRSWQNRDIWLITITDAGTGPPQDKPGFFVEGNIHAAELTASSAALHLIHRLLSGYGKDDQITRLLSTRTMYVIPRLCPDGAEEVLRTGCYVRSSMRPHPDDARAPGLHQGDVDGDGRSLFMRLPDPHGPWKKSAEDPRLLVRRRPDDHGGDYYRLLLEGEIVDYDGATIPLAPPFEGLDLAANFHSDWPEFPERPRSAGPFAGSEPEIQALLRAVTDRPSITGYVSMHTFGGIHLRPPLNSDDDFPEADRACYERLGEQATHHTGYPVMSYDDLKHEPYRVRGGQLAWLYHERGVYAWITELWSPLRAAGLTDFHPAAWLLDHPVENDLQLLEWSDQHTAGRGFVDWYPFNHPQLGEVELGGWNLVDTWYNPPMDLLEAEVAPHTEWVIYLALAAPQLEVIRATAEPVADAMFRIQVVVANIGWLPTQVTEKALRRSIVAGVVAELALPEGTQLVTGYQLVTDLGQLAGRSQALTSTTWWGGDIGAPDRALVEWVVQAASKTTVSVTARHPRAGTVHTDIFLCAGR